MTRIETAEKMVEMVGGRVWAPKEEDGTIRVYMGKKGFCQIESDGINIDSVGGHEFDDVKDAAREIGVTTYRR